ncbi:MAG: hypothetical protein V1889_02100 [archaeon]
MVTGRSADAVVTGSAGFLGGPEKLCLSFYLPGGKLVGPCDSYYKRMTGMDVVVIFARPKIFRSSWGDVYSHVSDIGDTKFPATLEVRYRRVGNGEEILGDD